MKILSVVGTRPQYIKLSPMVDIFAGSQIAHSWIDTGQHYSDSLSAGILEDLHLPKPLENFGIGSGTHAEQTARMLLAIEKYLTANKFDAVIVYGDTNSTLSAALAASKMGIPLIHIESGLRSSNRTMPEEINRIIVDHISDLHFAPTQLASANLLKEGIKNPIFSGDVMFDSLLKFKERRLTKVDPNQEQFILATIHRVENTDSESRLRKVIDQLATAPMKVELAAHPRLLKQIKEFKIEMPENKIRVIKPLSYTEMLNKIMNSHSVITDSGGLQKEAFMLGKLCITVRNETEWPETTVEGWNVLDFDLEKIAELINRPIPTSQTNFFGDGQAAQKIYDSILQFLGSGV
jgi:UDP-N-acetylglucosamine 2-epimerase